MGPKQSRDFASDTSGEQNKSTGVGSGSLSPTKTPKRSASPTTYGGAYVGVSTAFNKPDGPTLQRAKTTKEKKAERSRTPTQPRRSLLSRLTRGDRERDVPHFNDESAIKDDQKSASTFERGGPERQAFLRKLGFDNAKRSGQQSMNPSMLLLQSQEVTQPKPVENAAGQKRAANMSNTIVPESKFTSIMNKKGTEVQRNELMANTEVVSPAKVETGGAKLNKFQRGLKNHKVPETVPEEQEAPSMLNMTYQEVPDKILTTETELQPAQASRQTEKMPLVFDESLFLDKIKEFSPAQETFLPEVNEDAELVDEFDITQIGGETEEDRSLQNAAIIEAGVEEAKEDAAIEEEKRQEGFRLDQMSRDRTGDKLRKNLLSRLTYEKIWLTPMQKPKPYETAIIFDWDDTLLCTSFINPQGVYQHVDLGPVVQQHIKLLEQTSKRMLELAVTCGKVYIITNAAEGWVEFSCNRFMPEVMPVLQKITIISARAKYEARFPSDVPKWKLYAFLETQTELTNGNMKNVVALGDSMMEMDAAHHLAMKFQKALIKTVKFREFPKPNELVKQLNLVISKFDDIINNVRNLTIRLEKKQPTAPGR